MSEEQSEADVATEGSASKGPIKPPPPEPLASFRGSMMSILGIALCLFTLVATNFSTTFQELSNLAIFVMLGMMLCFLSYPLSPRWKQSTGLRYVDLVLVGVTVVCCGFVVVQTEEIFESFWLNGQRLGDRAGAETVIDGVIAIIGIFLVLEGTRRSIGWIVPGLALLFILHSFYCYLANTNGWPTLPSFMLPHSGQSLTSIANTAFLHQGVFGTATKVMFSYVFLFVIFGTFLELSGATQFIIDFSERVFGKSPGGPAKVSVLGSGLMGSLSGSAVANAMTTGSFTIPMMRNAGFNRTAAGGITAAAASGGALVPPVMGAGAYMMLELVDPQVTFLQIARAAIVPSALYYLSLWMIVHFYSKRMGVQVDTSAKVEQKPIAIFDGVVFFAALSALIGLLLWRFTPFKAVSGSLVVILLLTSFRDRIGRGTQIGKVSRLAMWIAFASAFLAYLGIFFLGGSFAEMEESQKSARNIFEIFLNASLLGLLTMIVAGLFLPDWKGEIRSALSKSAKGAVALVAASACVGIIIAIVDQTGIAGDFSSVIKGVVEDNLLLALVGIMLCSIVLGMGVPSVVCYLLMATLMGTLLRELGVIPLGAHLFIFYFGMMSMVTPPVALAAYASASIAKAKIMETAFAAFRFALVGFTLPYMFVYRPSLLLMNEQKWNSWIDGERALKDDDYTNNPSPEDLAEILAEANAAWPHWTNLAIALTASIIGIIALAAAIAGFLRTKMNWFERVTCMIAAALLLIPIIEIGGQDIGVFVNIGGGILFLAVLIFNSFTKKSPGPPKDASETTILSGQMTQS